VSSKKEKLIEEAQRLAMRGQIDKAIKAYEQVMAMDPGAVNQRQRLAELLIKSGREEDARAEFETIGKKYSSDGFYLKAISVYKRLQGLYPGDIPITLTLASLNEKHGLVANALAEYKQVYDYYEKNSSTEEALEILEKMQGVDPQNLNIKLKLAEAYVKADKKDEAYTLFGRLATMMQERGDTASFARLNTRIQQLFPKKSEFVLDVLAEQVANGNAASAVVGLQALLRTSSDDKRVWKLIIEAFSQLNQPQKVKLAYQHFLKCFPQEPSAQIGLISSMAAEGDFKGALEQLDTYELGLVAGRFLDDLERIYRLLDKIDPIDERVLEGLCRVCLAAGKADDAAVVQSKIDSLRGVSGKNQTASVQEDEQVFVEPDYFGGQAEDESDFGEISFADVDADINAMENGDEIAHAPDTSFADVDADINAVKNGDETAHASENSFADMDADINALYEGSGFAEAANEELDEKPEELEIEVEFDGEDDFEIPLDSVETLGDNWLDEVDEMFDTIAAKPRGVKFANGHDIADAQSHYDLGVAFREMGLYDEAINEFRQAASDTGRRLECLIVQGACLREKGDREHAEKVLRSLLRLGLGLDDACSVKYELALTYGACGKNDQLVELFTEIEQLNSGFRDVRTRLNAAKADLHSLDFSSEDLHGFDLK
jgi:tetratricopeptide (TPR) repeat protein